MRSNSRSSTLHARAAARRRPAASRAAPGAGPSGASREAGRGSPRGRSRRRAAASRAPSRRVSSTSRPAFSISVRTSPMPRIRAASRSAWKRSNASSCSPVEANMIGLAGDRPHRQRGAAAGVAVELGQHDAVQANRRRELLGDVDRVLAGHRVDDEQRLVGLHRAAATAVSSSISSASTCRRPAVSTISTSLPAVRARSSAQRAISTGDDLRPALVDGRAGALAEHDELLDRRRALRVARHERDRARVLLRQQPRELRRGRRLARALQARDQDHGRRARRERDPRGLRARPSSR